MTNQEIIEVFKNIADLLDIKGENPFKVRAYRRVISSIEELTVPVEELVRGERLDEIPGAGDAIRKKLVELVDTGQLEYYEKLKEGVPPGVMELLKVPGVGPKTAEMLVNEGGINSIDELEKALTDEKALPRITGKTREKILQGIKDLRSGGRVKLHAGD
jgi:DNA polymerase (family 10)